MNLLVFTARLPYQHDNSAEPAPSASRTEGAVPSPADHKTTAADGSPAHATHSSGPRSLGPSAGSQDSLPTPRARLVPETSQAEPASFQPLSSSDTHQHAAPSSPVGPAPPGFPPLSLTPGADTRRDAAQDREDREPPRPHPSSVSADSARTPSPQFGPQRSTDKAAAALVQDDSPPR